MYIHIHIAYNYIGLHEPWSCPQPGPGGGRKQIIDIVTSIVIIIIAIGIITS